MAQVTDYQIGSVAEYDGHEDDKAWRQAITAVEDELRAIADRSTAKRQEIEVLREERRVINREMDDWLAERARLYRIRGVIPGDVTVVFDGSDA